MPRIDRVWKKYRDRGFEVISICQQESPSPAEARQKVLDINAQYELTWPTVLDEGLHELLGLAGGHHPILLGPDGRMIAMTDEIESRELDEAIGAILDRAGR